MVKTHKRDKGRKYPLSKAEKLHNKDKVNCKLSVSRQKALKRILGCPGAPIQTTLSRYQRREESTNPAYPNFKITMSQRKGNDGDEDFECDVGSTGQILNKTKQTGKRVSAFGGDGSDRSMYNTNLSVTDTSSPTKRPATMTSKTTTTVTPAASSTINSMMNGTPSLSSRPTKRHSRFCKFCAAAVDECPEKLFGRHSYLRVKAAVVKDGDSNENTLSIAKVNQIYKESYKYAREVWNVQRYHELPIYEGDEFEVLPLCMAMTSYTDAMECFKNHIAAQTANEIENKKMRAEFENGVKVGSVPFQDAHV